MYMCVSGRCLRNRKIELQTQQNRFGPSNLDSRRAFELCNFLKKMKQIAVFLKLFWQIFDFSGPSYDILRKTTPKNRKIDLQTSQIEN